MRAHTHTAHTRTHAHRHRNSNNHFKQDEKCKVGGGGPRDRNPKGCVVHSLGDVTHSGVIT